MNNVFKLSNLLRIDLYACDRNISGLALDSRKVQPGDLFFAYRGEKVDGRDYINDAIARGAAAVVIEGDLVQVQQDANKTVIVTLPNLRARMGEIVAQFYGYPSAKLTVIGVTGTNGKTSITHFLAESLTAQQHLCGVIGTLGMGFLPKLSPVINTTPDIITLHQACAQLVAEHACAVAMEVSSHALVQERVAGVAFDIGVFTNLTRDHLDYHGTMEDYAAAKRQLFLTPNLGCAVINCDDEFGEVLVQELVTTLPVYGYSLKNDAVAAIRVKKIKMQNGVTYASVITPWGEGVLATRLLGEFNLSNLLAVLTVLGVMGIDLTAALAACANLSTVKGRMEMFGGDEKPLVVVDYAHTPDALERVLLTLRQHCRGKLWCVFGCGGDRDQGKRPLMGKIAEKYADNLIITNDNPRTEDPERIAVDIVSGMANAKKALIELDRKQAIEKALQSAATNDIVLIAGKGHEDYQIIGAEKTFFSDAAIVTDWFKN